MFKSIVRTTNPVTSLATLDLIASFVERDVLPAGRGAAIAASLRQMGSLSSSLPLSPADVCLAHMSLEHRTTIDDDRVVQRRFTCGQIGAVAGPLEFINWDNPPRGRAAQRWSAVLASVIAALAASEDPRHRSMCETAAREMQELALLLPPVLPEVP